MEENKEKLIGVPLRNDVKDALAERASENGRALGREAAKIIERTLMRKSR